MNNNTEMEKYFFRASAEDFKKIPGSPIAYAASSNIFSNFEKNKRIKSILNPKQGTSTGNDDIYVRFWFEINYSEIGLGFNSIDEALASSFVYFPLNKGGDYRKWYGNNEKLIKFGRGAYSELLNMGNNLPSRDLYFKKGLTWSKITSFKISVRYDDTGFVFSSVGLKGLPDDNNILQCLGYMNSKAVEAFTEILSPTLSIVSGDIEKLPFIENISHKNQINKIVTKVIDEFKKDWDSYETSWDFTSLPLLASEYRQATLAATYKKLRQQWLETTLEMQRLEEENNRIFIDAYGLQDELTPDVPLEEITLTCNPHYRYRLGKAWEDKPAEKRSKELEKRLLKDTMAEFISYAVGCMFGRYSLDKEGLILANQGEGLADFLKQVPNPSFEVDTNNVLPILDADWFTDDIVERFRKFLQLTFGKENFADNLKFIEKGLGKNIRTYFLRDFYTDHLQRYKKRPIYWQFSSSKGSFNALIYMHRYRSDTVSLVLNDYLREYRTKLEAQVKFQQSIEVNAAASARDKTQALKEIDRLNKVLLELNDYENDTLYPLATQQVSLDLDDGVKVNYPKLGNALKKVAGLSK